MTDKQAQPSVNLFVPSAPFLHQLKTLENHKIETNGLTYFWEYLLSNHVTKFKSLIGFVRKKVSEIICLSIASNQQKWESSEGTLQEPSS